jgi:hypothetical protein
VSRVRLTEFPHDLKLCPEHCVALYDRMRAVLPWELVSTLDPQVFFRQLRGPDAMWNLSMRDSDAWEERLKTLLVGLNHEMQKEVIISVTSTSFEAIAVADEQLGKGGERNFINSHFHDLLDDLDKNSMMPCMFFNMNQRGCRWLTTCASESLEAKEREYKKQAGILGKIETLEKEIQEIEVVLERHGWHPDDETGTEVSQNASEVGRCPSCDVLIMRLNHSSEMQ